MSTSASTTEVESPTGGRQARARKLGVGQVLERSGIPIFLLILVLIFGFNDSTGEQFRSSANLQNIFANQSVTGLIALGMVLPMVTGYFDLSVPAIAGLSSVTFAAVSGTHGQPVVMGLAAAIAIALLAGAINGTLVAVMRLNAIIITLGSYTLIGGLLLLYTKGLSVGNGLPASVGDWGSEQWLGVARPLWLLLVAATLTWYLLIQTPFGRRLAAIGSNEPAARLAGFRVNRSVFVAFMLSGLFGGIAGALLTSRVGSADASTGSSVLFPALAAVFLGQTAIRPGHYNVWGTIFGLFLLAVAVNGFTLLGAEAWVTQVFNGAALMLSVTVSSLMARTRDRRARAAALVAAQRRSADGGNSTFTRSDEASRVSVDA